MAIPASHIVNVLPRVIAGGSRDLELNGLLITNNNSISADTLVLSFPSAAAVAAYFGIGSVEHKVADVYFTSYNNKLTAPKALYIARRIAADSFAWLRSRKINVTVQSIQAITDGAFTVSIDNTAYAVDSVDFSTVTSYSDVASKIEGALTAKGADVTVAYSSLFNAFTVTGVTVGAGAVVNFFEAPSSGTDIAKLLGFAETSGAVMSTGHEAMSEETQMHKIISKTQNWVSFTTAWEAAVDEALLWAEWANKNYGYLYVGYTTSDDVLSQDNSFDVASMCKEAGYDHTTIVYGSVHYAAFIMGVVASVAWQRVNGTITAAFKRQSGLAPWVADETQAQVLESKNCNYFGNFATRNAEFVFLYPGCLSASDYGFIDPYINSVWFNNRLQVALMDGITSVGRVPYNTRGYTMVRAWMVDPIKEALNNATIEPGVVLSERQRSEVMNEAGLDISKELWTQGYYAQILDPGASVRAQRGTPVISLWYTYGGAIQKIEVASTAIL